MSFLPARAVRSLAACTFVLFSACEAPQQVNAMAPPRLGHGTVILVPPPDVQLFEYHLSGQLEPRADWSEAAERNVSAALAAEDARRPVEFVPLDYAALSDGERAEVAQIEKLHETVAMRMMRHRHLPEVRLPTKSTVYEWSLGPEVAVLRRAGGDRGKYALFVTLEDSFSSGGRRTVQILAAMAGVGYVPGGVQVGYASLVDLDTGEVAWFGSLARGFGDLREPSGAAEAVAELLSGLTL